MAEYYLDTNGNTIGFGTLTATPAAGDNTIPCSSSNLGNVAIQTIAFSTITPHILNFGSSATNQNTAVGTLNMFNGRAFSVNGIRFQNLTGNQTIAPAGTGTFQFIGTSPFADVTANGRLIINCVVAGTVNWQKRGSSILRLAAANTFSGGMTITDGTVEIANASALGTGTVTMTGGKLSSSSTTGYGLANALTLNGTMTLGDATNNGVNTFSGTLTVSGASTLTAATAIGFYGSFQGSGNLSLGGNNYFFTGASNNTYSGALTLTSGNILLASNGSGTPNQLSSASSVTLNGGSLFYLGSNALTINHPIYGSNSVINVSSTSASGITFSGNLSAYAGQLQVYASTGLGAVAAQKVTVSSNTLALDYMRLVSDVGVSQTLRQTFAYNGASNFSYGNAIFLVPGATNTLTGVVENLSSPSSSMALNSAVVIPNNFNAAFEIAATNGPLTFTNFISGPWNGNSGVLRLIKTGTYAATLSGVNEFTGSVSVSQGTLSANSATALGLATSTAGISVTSGATLSLGVAVTYSSRSLTISGTGSSNAPNNGALIIANAGTNTFSNITIGATGTYIRATNSGSILSPFTPANNSIVLGASAGSDFIPFASLFNVFSGTGSVTYGGHSGDTGIVRADVRHTYTGNTTLAYGTTYINSTLELAATGGPLGNKSLTAANTLLMTGGTLSYLDGNVDYSGRFSTAGGQQWRIAAGTATTFATALVGASSLRLFGGSLTLSSAASTFSGGVTLTEGTLYAGAAQNGVSGPLGITGTITFSPAGTGVLAYTSASASFDYSSRFATSSGQSRRINANGESVTFSTALGGDNELRLVGSAGTLTLAVANTYTQGTTLSVGTLKCGNVTSLGTGGLAQANGTTLHVTATGGKLTIQGAHTNTGTGNRTIRIGA